MITLYQFPTSPFSEKVRRIFNYKAIDYVVENVPRAEVERYALISPTGKFPAITDGDKAVWDSTDIAHYVETKFPERPLIPQDPREQALTHILEDWADESLYFYELTMRIAWIHNCEGRTAEEFAASIPGATAAQVLPRISAGAAALAKAQGLGRKPQAQVVHDVERHLAALAGLLDGRQWLVGDRLTLADIAVASQLRVLNYAREVEAMSPNYPAVTQWAERVDHLAPPDAPRRP